MKASFLFILFVLNVSSGFFLPEQQQLLRTLLRVNVPALDQQSEPHRQSLQELEEKKRLNLKRELIIWGEQTDRGFRASLEEQNKIRQMIFQLAALNPTPSPAEAYFSTTRREVNSTASRAASIKGKWTLVFTDAPDITSLKSPLNPLADLGRIGQECDPPTITNVIEWKAPVWVQMSPFVPDLWKGRGDTGEPRILQKVVTKATASSQAPSKVFLKLAGLKVEGPPVKDSLDSKEFSEVISQIGILAGGLQLFPVNLQGPLSAPFGEFELLYLDEEMRITRTGQNFFTVNLKDSPGSEWF